MSVKIPEVTNAIKTKSKMDPIELTPSNSNFKRKLNGKRSQRRLKRVKNSPTQFSQEENLNFSSSTTESDDEKVQIQAFSSDDESDFLGFDLNDGSPLSLSKSMDCDSTEKDKCSNLSDGSLDLNTLHSPSAIKKLDQDVDLDEEGKLLDGYDCAHFMSKVLQIDQEDNYLDTSSKSPTENIGLFFDDTYGGLGPHSLQVPIKLSRWTIYNRKKWQGFTNNNFSVFNKSNEEQPQEQQHQQKHIYKQISSPKVNEDNLNPEIKNIIAEFECLESSDDLREFGSPLRFSFKKDSKHKEYAKTKTVKRVLDCESEKSFNSFGSDENTYNSCDFRDLLNDDASPVMIENDIEIDLNENSHIFNNLTQLDKILYQHPHKSMVIEISPNSVITEVNTLSPCSSIEWPASPKTSIIEENSPVKGNAEKNENSSMEMDGCDREEIVAFQNINEDRSFENALAMSKFSQKCQIKEKQLLTAKKDGNLNFSNFKSPEYSGFNLASGKQIEIVNVQKGLDLFADILKDTDNTKEEAKEVACATTSPKPKMFNFGFNFASGKQIEKINVHKGMDFFADIFNDSDEDDLIIDVPKKDEENTSMETEIIEEKLPSLKKPIPLKDVHNLKKQDSPNYKFFQNNVVSSTPVTIRKTLGTVPKGKKLFDVNKLDTI